jgi:hypothetical protein
VQGFAPYQNCFKMGVEHANPGVAAITASEDACKTMAMGEIVEGPQNREDCTASYYDGTETE